MLFDVDVQLRYSTFSLVETSLNELASKQREYWNESHSKPVDLTETNLTKFCCILENVIINRLSLMTNEELCHQVITSKDLLLQGQGSLEICDPPTEAQIKIIKSLIKVVLYQQNEQFERCGTQEGQSNLLLSLFVKKIYCEVCDDGELIPTNLTSRDSLEDTINTIFTTKNSTNNDRKVFLSTKKEYKVSLFHTMEDYFESIATLTQKEFNKIDLNDNVESEFFDNETTVFGAKESLISNLPISNHTMEYTNITMLPSNNFEGSWETLEFDSNVKQKLYNYATISLRLSTYFSRYGSDNSMISNGNNKLLLLHGPPGTGKTSLCKALCNKLAIRNAASSDRQFVGASSGGILIEISCSKIFSRWYGESSKNLTTILADVENILKHKEKKNYFVCVLFDEVEAIAFSRNNSIKNNETTDSVRVVSSLLTLLDSLKKYDNFLVLSTSNLLESLDPAFVDRADGIFHVNNPSEKATLLIIESSIKELLKLNVIYTDDNRNSTTSDFYEKTLKLIAQTCFKKNLSGRTLKKLSMVCMSEYFNKLPIHINQFLIALSLSIKNLNTSADT